MSQKTEDCYFYYYSSCSKGDACAFRHSPMALGSEVVCTLWREGRCTRPDCKFRHMDIKVQRNTTPCYWESQPGGCTKPHCVFMHARNKGKVGGLTSLKNRVVPPSPVPTVPPEESEDRSVSVATSLPSDDLETIRTPQVAPVVVNPFDEESDADSSTGSPAKIPTPKKVKLAKIERPIVRISKGLVSPRKTVTQNAVPGKNLQVKSLEEIHDEELQRVKEALAQADEYLSQSLDSDLPVESYEELIKEIDDKIQSTVDEPVVRRKIQVSSTTALRSVKSSERESQAPAGGRRIVVVDEYEKQEEPHRKTVTVMDRLGSSQMKVVKPTIKREVSGNGVRSRLGLKMSTDAAEDKISSVKGRLGIVRSIKQEVKESDLTAEDKKPLSSIKGRLGIVRNIKQDVEERDESPESSKVVVASVKRRLGPVRSAKTSTSDDENSQDSGSVKQAITISQRIGLKRNTSEQKQQPEGNLGIKSLEEIRRAKRSRLGLPVESEESSLSISRPRLARQRPTKKEQVIYRPPPAKIETTVTVKSTIKSRLEPSVAVSSSANVKSRIDLKARNEPKKKSDEWGVKTFAEIMREKRLLRDSGKSTGSPEKNTAHVSPMKHTVKRGISPISFTDMADKPEPPQKSRKFTPIVFDLSQGDNEAVIGEEEVEEEVITGRGDERPTFPTEENATEDESTTVKSKQKPPLEKLIITPARRRSSQGLQSPTASPPFKSPATKSPATKSPATKSPQLKSPVISANPSPTRTPDVSITTTPTSAKLPGDDSFLNDMDYLLEEGDTIDGEVGEIGEDDLLNEMEELLA